MDLTIEDKLHMSLDEIIQLQWLKQNAEFKKRQRRKRKLKRLKYKQCSFNRPNLHLYGANKNMFSNKLSPYPLALLTRKYRQLAAYKSIQRAKYALLRRHLHKRNAAYRYWEERNLVQRKCPSSTNDYWDDVNSNYSNPVQTNLRSTRKWITKMVNFPRNLMIKLKNNYALRSQLNCRRPLAFKSALVNDVQNLPLTNENVPSIPVVTPRRVPMTLNERFSELPRVVWHGEV